MEHLISKLIANPFMVSTLVISFTVCMVMFRARVKREDSPGYQRPDKESFNND
jgi:hypothetical protein